MRTIPFLSVSALGQLETQPNKFYLQRLADTRLPREPQGLPAAVGTMFDIYVKLHLLGNNLLVHGNTSMVKQRFIDYPWPQAEKRNRSLRDLFFESLEPQNRVAPLLGEIELAGMRAFNAYIKSKLYLESVFYDVDIKNIYNLTLNLSGQKKVVPIYGITDMLLGATAEVCYPVDLKVSGYGSGASPKPGYYCSYDEAGHSLGEHSGGSATEECHAFDSIDKDWATQGCVYGWMCGKKLFEPFEFGIHGVYFGRTKQDGTRSLKVCGYRGTITPEFQKMVALRLIKAWDIVTGVNAGVPWDEELLLCEMLARQEKWHG